MKDLDIRHNHAFVYGLSNTRPKDRPGERGDGQQGLTPLLGAMSGLKQGGGLSLAAAKHVESLAGEIGRYRAMPGQQPRPTLDAYVAVMRNICRLCDQALGSLAASPDGGRGQKVLRDELLAAKDFAGRKLMHYNELRALSQPQAIARVKDLVNNHFKTVAGRHLVNMIGVDKHLEYVLPTHSATINAASRWDLHLRTELDAGRDPYATLVDFLLTLEDDETLPSKARTYLDDDARDFCRVLYRGEVKSLQRERLLHALYRYDAGHRGARYEPHLDGHDPLNRLASRFLPYTTVPYPDQRMELADLHGGDLYVMDSAYRLYTCHTSEFHSRLLAGNAVMGAGVIVVKEGKVRAIDNKSGHYQPTWKHLHQVVCELEFHDVFAPDAFVGLMIPGKNTMFFSVEDFIELGNLGFPYAATRGVVERYHEAYRGGPPVPPPQVELLAPGDREWGEGRSGKNRWREFLLAAFPKTVRPILDGLNRLLVVEKLPTLAEWKKESDAGLFAGRGEALQQVDSGLEYYHRVLDAQAHRPIPDGDKIGVALDALDIAINYWLLQKQDTKESTRRPKVVKLQQAVQAAKAIVPKLKPQAAQENLALVGIQV